MFVNVKYLEKLRFNNCKDCSECCKRLFAPLVLEDFEKVYKFFPIVFVEINYLRPVIILGDGVNYCKYLIDGKCSIYENRPPACRIYPFSPFYDELFLDISCKGVGIKGDTLPLKFEEFKKSNFYEKRVENISQKMNDLIEWMDKKELIFFDEFKNFKLFKLKKEYDYFSKLHLLSIKTFYNFKASSS